MQRTLFMSMCLVFVFAITSQVSATTNPDTKKNAAGYQICEVSQAATEAALAECPLAALAEVMMANGEVAQPAQVLVCQTTVAQVVETRHGDYDVILPIQLANSTVATQSHFGKEVADAPYLAGCLAPATAHFAQWQIGTAIPGVVMVT